ncbi:MAG: peptide-methionine (S)-S-oxide reductase MsrA [Alphaproteobacteria bacterium]|nr:peptide-methionine (S)-S-oxide reductase MsrA [Alphaproteobacteria bacterium]
MRWGIALSMLLLSCPLGGAVYAADTGGSSAAVDHRTAIFAGGCFWCIQSAFDDVPGVHTSRAGYTGGTAETATYRQVSTGKTKHREAVEVVYDPLTITYPQLLDIFWQSIDPTDPGGQMHDRGPQYTTAIYYATQQQKEEAETSRKAAEAKLNKPIATQILPVESFYSAEEEHQFYHRTHKRAYQAYVEGSQRKQTLKRIWGAEDK